MVLTDLNWWHLSCHPFMGFATLSIQQCADYIHSSLYVDTHKHRHTHTYTENMPSVEDNRLYIKQLITLSTFNFLDMVSTNKDLLKYLL